MTGSEFKPRRLRLEEFDNLWAIQYSVAQNAFDVRTVSEMLEINRSNVVERIPVDYVPIGFTDSRQEADTVVEKLRDNLDEQAARTERYKADATKSDADRLRWMEHCDDTLWAKFRMSTKS